MKQSVSLPHDTPPYIQEFILVWKKRKGYQENPSLSLGEAIELIIATSNNLHNEDSDGRFFNHSLQNNESLIAWDGEELIDTLLYEVIENIKKRRKSSSLFAT